MLLFYLLFFLCLYVSPFGACPVFLVSFPISAFYADILCYLGFYARYCAWCALGGGSLCG